MSQTVTASVKCPGCGEQTPWTHHPSVNATLDPGLREKVLSQQLLFFDCANCGLSARIRDPLLYHDMDLTFMIQLVDEERSVDVDAIDRPYRALGEEMWSLASVITTRLVRSPNELVEKILIFEAELDDRLVECLKLRLKLKERESLPGDLYFQQRTDDGDLVFAHLHDGETRHFAIPAAAWEDHASRLTGLGPVNAERWPRVDADYAMTLYETLAARSSSR